MRFRTEWVAAPLVGALVYGALYVLGFGELYGVNSPVSVIAWSDAIPFLFLFLEMAYLVGTAFVAGFVAALLSIGASVTRRSLHAVAAILLGAFGVIVATVQRMASAEGLEGLGFLAMALMVWTSIVLGGPLMLFAGWWAHRLQDRQRSREGGPRPGWTAAFWAFLYGGFIVLLIGKGWFTLLWPEGFACSSRQAGSCPSTRYLFQPEVLQAAAAMGVIVLGVLLLLAAVAAFRVSRHRAIVPERTWPGLRKALLALAVGFGVLASVAYVLIPPPEPYSCAASLQCRSGPVGSYQAAEWEMAKRSWAVGAFLAGVGGVVATAAVLLAAGWSRGSSKPRARGPGPPNQGPSSAEAAPAAPAHGPAWVVPPERKP